MYFKMAKESYQNTFVIRSYGFSELAQLYLPNISRNSASYRLKCWIEKNTELSTKLKLQPFTKILTPAQVRLIVEYLDFPEVITTN